MFNDFPYLIRALVCAVVVAALTGCHDDDDQIDYGGPDNGGGPGGGGSGVLAPVSLTKTVLGDVYAAEGSVSILMPDEDNADQFITQEENLDGRTLYIFDNDEPGSSSCNSTTCLESWPPLLAADDERPSSPFTIVERSDGLRQWALRDMPLYLNAGDSGEGDVNGDGVGGVWHVASAQPIILNKFVEGDAEGEFLVASGATEIVTADGELQSKQWNRFSLYTFDNDDPGVSNCTGEACVTSWPPLMVSEGEWPVEPFSAVERVVDDAGNTALQWAFHGKPLYFNANDSAAGDTSGANAPNWRLARPIPWQVSETARSTVLTGFGKVRTLVESGVFGEFETSDKGMSGFGLYTFDKDNPHANDETDVSTCTDTCLENWPPLIANEGAEPFGDFTLVQRASGEMQWALHGWPLYFRAADTTAGQITGEGDGTGAWHLARVAPAAIITKDVEGDEELVLSGFHNILRSNRSADAERESYTLYTSGNDANGKSNCFGPCAIAWRPLYASEDAHDFGDFTVIERASGVGVGVDVDDVAAILREGQQEYDSMCAGCHGNEGDGDTLIDVEEFSEATLINEIDRSMPIGNAGNCVDDCADSVAAYILNGYSTEVPDTVSGEREYAAQCVGCHGTNGAGDTPIDDDEFNLASLAELIEDKMPKGNVGNCVGECARDIAAFILNGYEAKAAALDLNNGEQEYTSMCVSCHGANGDGDTHIDDDEFNLASLTELIDDEMPVGNAGNCVGECARDIAAFILNGYEAEVAVPDLNNGEQEYRSMCVGCHGANGDGDTHIDGDEFNLASLTELIDDEMPEGNAGNCVDECAVDVAAYILNGYSSDRVEDGRQWTYKGQPLYFFNGELDATTTSGENIDGVWHVAVP